MSLSLLILAVTLALVASPHCISMCGCGLAKRWLKPRCQTESRFLIGRFLGYTAMGAVAGGASQAMTHWVAGQIGFLNALHWVLISVMTFSAFVVLWQAKPFVLEQGLLVSQFKTSQRVLFKPSTKTHALKVGGMWWLLPCGVLYSAFVLAYLSGSALQGVLIMAVFAASSSVSLVLAARLQSWMQVRFTESLIYRVNATLVLLGVTLMLSRQLGWIETPQLLSDLGLCL